MTFNRETLSVLGLAAILTAEVFFYIGWYQWEFKRPPTAVYHNQYVSGDNATVTQNPTPKQKHWSFGLYGNRKTLGGVVLFTP